MSLANATLTNTSAVIFTCANAGGSAVTTCVFKNHDTSARTVTLHACPAGEAEVDENMILEVSIPAGDTYVFNDKLLLANTDTLEAFADTTSVVTATISYLDL